jgi:C1A family cysteine protease
MIYIVLFLILFLVTIFICILYKKNKDNFIAPINFITDIPLRRDKLNPVLNTPLVSLKSNLIIHPTIDVLSFFSYSFNKILSPVNQGESCGSCWAIVVTSIISDRIIAKYNGSKKIRLSTQQLLDCYNFPNGCDGENPEDVFKWLIDNKIIMTTEKNLPYQQMYSNIISEKCKKYNEGIMLEPNSLYKIVEYIDNKNFDKKILEKNVENMKKEIILNGPFFATIAVYNDLLTFTENEPYFQTSNNFVGGHAIEIIGYCNPGIDKRKGYIEGYWIVKNSWGKDWPKNPIYPGFFTIKMGRNECGIESRCGSVNPIKDKKITNISNVAITNFDIFKETFLEN